jgi:hypothetical protein
MSQTVPYLSIIQSPEFREVVFITPEKMNQALQSDQFNRMAAILIADPERVKSRSRCNNDAFA